jgi:hypothetical protein
MKQKAEKPKTIICKEAYAEVVNTTAENNTRILNLMLIEYTSVRKIVWERQATSSVKGKL